MIKTKVFLLMPLFLCQQAIAQEVNYPFNLPENMQASIDIKTGEQESFNNKLLATNIFNFDSSTEQNFIDKFDPKTIRFPHGLWANWYDWRTDISRVFGTETFEYTHRDGNPKTTTIDHLSSLKIFENNNIKVGINGLTELNTERKNQGKGFDVVWTFNMSADGSDFDNGSPESVARYQDLIARGFAVTDIEMGNENFYPGQRSSIIPDAKDYIARAKSMSKALKALNPNLRLSIPLLRRDSWASPDWNQDLTVEQDYFDTVTVHTYVGSDPDNADNSDEAYSTALTARHHIAKSVNDYSLKVAPDKPIWLTEWGVKSGGANAASVLGMADVYLFMSENQDIYDRANWFSVNGQLNSFVVWEEYESPSGAMRPRIKYPLEKTAFGLTHYILRDVLEDSVMLKTDISSVELDNGVQATSARAVIKDNKIEILALNLTDQPTQFNVKLDGNNYTGTVEHSAMAFEQLDEERTLPVDAEPLEPVISADGLIRLPKLSVNKIVLKESNITSDLIDLNLDTQSKTYAFDEGQTITVVATTQTDTSEITSVTFSENGQTLKTLTQAPYQIDWQPVGSGVKTITATAKRADGAISSSKAFKVNMLSLATTINVELASPAKTTLTTDEALELTANATTNKGEISQVEFKVNGETLHTATSTPYSFNWQPTTTGTYNINLVATHTDQTTQASEPISVEVVEPLAVNVELVAPAKTSLQLDETLKLIANASANQGEIVQVEFKINGETLYTATSLPYTYDWQPSAAGTYKINVLATHNTEVTKSSAEISIDVSQAESPDPETPESQDDNKDSSGGSFGGYWALMLLSIFSIRRFNNKK